MDKLMKNLLVLVMGLVIGSIFTWLILTMGDPNYQIAGASTYDDPYAYVLNTKTGEVEVYKGGRCPIESFQR